MIDRPGARGLPVLDLPNPRVGKAAAPATRPPLVDGRLEEYLPEPQALPRFFLWTLGCQMNRSDSEEMAGRLLAAGCDEASELEAADLVVINTCAIREAAEQKVIGRQGMTINAIRSLLLAGSAKRGMRCTLEIVEEPGGN